MADDTLELREELDFHSCNVPYGIQPFIFEDLTEDQQRQLNLLRVETIREDEKYLASHPEVRGIISLILRRLFRVRPQRDVIQYIARYFLQPAEDISDEVQKVIFPRRFRKCEGDSAVKIRQPDVKLSEEKRERFLEPPEIPTRVTDIVVCSKLLEESEDVGTIVANIIEEILTCVEIMLKLPVDVLYATHVSDDILSDFNYRGRFDTAHSEPVMGLNYEFVARSISQEQLFRHPPEKLDYIIEHHIEDEYGVAIPDEKKHETAELLPEEETLEKQEEDQAYDLKKLSVDEIESPISASAQGLLRGFARKETEPQEYDLMRLSEEKLESEEQTPKEEALEEEDKDREVTEFIKTTSQTSFKEDTEKVVSREEVLEKKESTDLIPDIQAESADVPDDSEGQKAKTESTVSLEKKTSSSKKKLKKSSSSRVKKRSSSKLKSRSGGSLRKEDRLRGDSEGLLPKQDSQEESPEEPRIDDETHEYELSTPVIIQARESAEDIEKEPSLTEREEPYERGVDIQDEDAEVLKMKETISKEERAGTLSDDKGADHEGEHSKASHAVSFSDRRDVIEVDDNEFVEASAHEERQDTSENTEKGNEIYTE